eukprot:m.241246 g.241246  ORF g.241246 m.241246 type:complete len:410 (-) comp13812_c0_seq1:248-1477(-)
MCGRTRCALDPTALRSRCALGGKQPDWKGKQPAFEPSYNICPTNQSPVILSDGSTQVLQLMKWGYPSFVPGTPLINARAETILEKPTFRGAVSGRHRCVVVAEGFYEWHGQPGRRQAYFVHRNGDPKDPPLLLMAAIYMPERDDLPGAYCILTLAATPEFAQVHDRMPAILTPDQALEWLNPALATEKVVPHLEQCHDLVWYPVGSSVNSMRNKGADCCAPLPKSGSLTSWLTRGQATDKKVADKNKKLEYPDGHDTSPRKRTRIDAEPASARDTARGKMAGDKMVGDDTAGSDDDAPVFIVDEDDLPPAIRAASVEIITPHRSPVKPAQPLASPVRGPGSPPTKAIPASPVRPGGTPSCPVHVISIDCEDDAAAAIRACPACTLHNPAARRTCEACGGDLTHAHAVDS